MLLIIVTFSLITPTQQQDSGCKNVSNVFKSSDGQSCQAMECFEQKIILCAGEEPEESGESEKESESKEEEEKPAKVKPALPFELPDHAFVLNPFEEEEEDARIVGLFHFIHKVIRGIKKHPVIGTLGYLDWVLAWLVNAILEKSVEIIIEELLQVGHHRPNPYHTRPYPKLFQRKSI